MTIRKATIEDLDPIFAIYQRVALDRSKLGDVSYESQVQKNGFLLGLESKDDYQQLIHEAYQFLVAEDNGSLLGYIIADHREKFYDDEYKTWFDEELRGIYYTSSHAMTVAGIAVDPNSDKKGVATQLLQILEQQLIAEGFTHLYSIITLAPLTNCPTIVFHSKNGFKRIAMGRPRPLFDLENYSGALLSKSLK